MAHIAAFSLLVRDYDEAIAWYTDLDAGLAEAKRTNKPILLMSAAPSCSGVSGVW